MTDDMIQEILDVSRARNRANGISGLLLYNGRRFLQALEGEHSAVKATYERIKRDERHHSLAILASRDVMQRSFGNWAMAAERVRGDTGSTDLASQVEALTANLEDQAIKMHFRRYAEAR